MSALDQPLDRVNYFNGQRLEAADFRTDQDYQMRVRRKLFASLYSVGIVQGLEVTKHPTDLHKVVVAPGVALDSMGREIILLDPADVQVSGTPSSTPGVIFGNFLVIAYAEQRAQPVTDGCAANLVGSCGGNIAWGAPTRIRAVPQLEMLDTWPTDLSGKIVLAQIGLQAACQVSEIQSGVRRYAVAAKPPTVRPISLEGEKDIDASNPKKLFLHIDGGVPDTVTLYLRGDQFSTLFYTELGSHAHPAKLAMDALHAVPAHHHTLTALQTDKQLGGDAVHAIAQTFSGAGGDFAIRLWQPSSEQTDLTQGGARFTFRGIEHAHGLTGGQTDDAGAIAAVTPTGKVTVENNSNMPQARSDPADKPLTYIKALIVRYDGQDITVPVLKQLNGNDPVAWPNNATLGDGTNGHPFVQNGTGKIDLTQLGLDFTPGEHSLSFEVAADGGQVKYNLYVG